MRYRVIVVTGSLIVLAVVSAQTNAQTLTTLFSFHGTPVQIRGEVCSSAAQPCMG